MEKKILMGSCILIIVLSFIPFFWIEKLSFDLSVFTEEWYKALINLGLIILGFFLFDYLIDKSKKDDTNKLIVHFESKLYTQKNSLKELLKSELDKSELLISILHFKVLIKTININPSLTSKFIDLYIVFYEQKVESSFEILLKYSKNEQIETSVLNNSIRNICEYFKNIEENSMVNRGR
ncbi:MAG: hypothetical protein HOO91_02170 [Bacteroidales bacterium]|nr:hypothetical protein [Bacteroidales bacterium]